MAITAKERQERLAKKLAEAEAKAKALRDQKKALDAKMAARQGAAARKAEAHAKILAGAAALALLQSGRISAADLLAALAKDKDRAALGAFLGVVEPAPAAAPAPDSSGQVDGQVVTA